MGAYIIDAFLYPFLREKMSMGTIKTLFKSRHKPQNNRFGSTYNFFFGSTISRKTVNERTAMQTIAVYA